MVNDAHARTHTQEEYLAAIKRLSTQLESHASSNNPSGEPADPHIIRSLASDLATVCLMYMATLTPPKAGPGLGTATDGAPSPSTGGPTDTGGTSCP
jgi:hypothetical protein